MKQLPGRVRDACENREGPAVLATVNTNGIPNIIYVGAVRMLEGSRIVVADNKFDKTRRNLEAGCKGAVLFQAASGEAFQLKGSLEYHNSGPAFDFMKSWNPPQHAGHAAAVLNVEEAFSGAERLP